MDDSTIWRYMDFTKFVDLLSTQTLFFCRSDHFEDPFEGSFPFKHVERKVKEIKDSSDDFSKEIKTYEEAGKEFRKYVFINCWHINEHESAALWKLYLKSNEGIAIRSSRNKLGASISESKYDAWSVPVNYINFESNDPPVPTRMAPFRYKRKSFEHERELRSIIFTNVHSEQGERLSPPDEYGLSVRTNIKMLIESIYVAPTAPEWFHKLTEEICNKFEINAPVFHSSLNRDCPKFI